MSNVRLTCFSRFRLFARTRRFSKNFACELRRFFHAIFIYVLYRERYTYIDCICRRVESEIESSSLSRKVYFLFSCEYTCLYIFFGLGVSRDVSCDGVFLCRATYEYGRI